MTKLLAALSRPDRELHLRHALHVAVLLACSVVCCIALVGRRLETGEGDYRFLVWNLFLAWMPLGFATVAHLLYVTKGVPVRRPLLVATLGLWLLFFPNAPYLLSDLKHLAVWRPEAPLWFDAVLVGSFVLTGIFTGFASLVLVHDLARRRFGIVGGWTAVALASAASGFGIYLGRFVRLNSWDVFTRPMRSAETILLQFTHDGLVSRTVMTTAIYGAFILLGYIAVITLARVAAATSVEPASLAEGARE